MADDAKNALTAALDRMWVQFLPQIEERVGVLETAAQAYAAGSLSVAQQQDAQAAAHKLAGALGTFGLNRGTELARELEIINSQQNDPDAGLAERLAVMAGELRAIISTRK